MFETTQIQTRSLVFYTKNRCILTTLTYTGCCKTNKTLTGHLGPFILISMLSDQFLQTTTQTKHSKAPQRPPLLASQSRKEKIASRLWESVICLSHAGTAMRRKSRSRRRSPQKEIDEIHLAIYRNGNQKKKRDRKKRIEEEERVNKQL